MLNVLHHVHKMDRAGQETFLMNLFRKIDRDQIQFDFLCTDHEPGDYDEEIRSLGGKLLYLPTATARGPFKQGQKFFSMIRTLKKHRCEVFHIHTHHALDAFRDALAAKLCGIPTVVVHSHNTGTLFHPKAHKLFRKLLPLLPIHRFACSNAAGQWMFPAGNFQVIHNGLDVDALYFRESIRASVRDELSWQGKKIIGHVGRFNEQKNHRFLIEIFSVIHRLDPNTQLVLCGKGELEDEIVHLVDQKGLTGAVCFMGVRTDVARLYQGMDLLLFPSLFEGLSVVLLEAQACDLPCLVSDTNSPEVALTNRIVTNSLGDPADAWAQTALKLLNQATPRQDNRDEIRSAGYDIGQLAQSLDLIYRGDHTP